MKILASIFAVALTAFSCSAGVSKVRTYPLPGLNATSYTYPLPIAEVHEKAWDAFSFEHQGRHPIFERSESLEVLDVLFAECATNAVFGKAIFRDPVNTNDIYLHNETPFVISPVYHNSKGGLPFIASFHLHLTAAGTNTIVSVTTPDAEVIAGTKFGFGPCGPGQANVYVNVKPTTIEEYSILRYLGSYLGVTNMPPVILPKQ